jgi:hypothetical protein
MKAQTRFPMRLLVAVAMLPLTSGAANAQSLKGIFGQQAKSLVEQAQGAASGVGTIDLTHPTQIISQAKSNAQAGVTQIAGQAEQTGLGDAQGILGAMQGKITQLQSKIPQSN